MNIQTILKRFIPMSETMFYILFSLREERHGYGIMQHVKDLTKGRVTLGAGTLYQSLGKLEGDGLIASTKEEDRKKYYRITGTGKLVLDEEIRRIKEIYTILEGYS